MNGKALNARAAAARALSQVLRGESLSTALPAAADLCPQRDRGLMQELCYGTLRWYPAINEFLELLLKSPLRRKDLDVQTVLACGIYQLWKLNTPAHAALNESVAAVKQLGFQWARGLVNGVLRNFQRQHAELEQRLATKAAFQTAHPRWLAERITADWPKQAEAIFNANNLHPPMTLRVNARLNSRALYLEKLAAQGIAAQPCPYSAQGITLEQPTDVLQLPGFADGAVSIQDEAAQLSADLLQLAKGQRVLDACCAPGGKSCHILESAPDISLTAIDLEPRRLARVEENLTRLNLQAKLIAADAGALDSWWDGQPFQRILLDAPCSATGVIRRHPDIKVLRQPQDVAKLDKIQLQLLKTLWSTLAPDGILLYATCSLLKAENDQVVSQFLAQQKDAQLALIEADWGTATDCGRQLFPQPSGHDGFYYARLTKRAAEKAE